MTEKSPTSRTPKRFRRVGILAAVAAFASAVLIAPVATTTSADAAANVTTAVYVEVNSQDMSNVAKYTLTGTDRPAFDLAMIFAANINWDDTAKKPYLHMNERVTATLKDAANQVRPLQAKGTKVLLSVLGNHDPIGLASMTQAQAQGFAKEVAAVVAQYGLDGVDLDDEWSKYGASEGAPEANSSSFIYLLQALRAEMGADKLITFYKIGPSAQSMEYNGVKAGTYLDYAWNPYYGTYSVPTVPGLAPSVLAPAAVDISTTSTTTAVNFANRTISDGYGSYMLYNLTSGNSAAYLSSIMQVLKGTSVTYTP